MISWTSEFRSTIRQAIRLLWTRKGSWSATIIIGVCWQHGGILLDGRLTLPRFVTDPFTLIEELQDNKEFADALSQLQKDCEVDDLYACIVSHPTEIMQLIGGLPEVIGSGINAGGGFSGPVVHPEFLRRCDRHIRWANRCRVGSTARPVDRHERGRLDHVPATGGFRASRSVIRGYCRMPTW